MYMYSYAYIYIYIHTYIPRPMPIPRRPRQDDHVTTWPQQQRRCCSWPDMATDVVCGWRLRDCITACGQDCGNRRAAKRWDCKFHCVLCVATAVAACHKTTQYGNKNNALSYINHNMATTQTNRANTVNILGDELNIVLDDCGFIPHASYEY